MPKEGISVYFTIKDGASQVLKTIGDHTKALDKETQALAQSEAALKKANEPLIKTQQELKGRLEQVSRQIADNRKEWQKYDSELARDSMNDAIAEQDQLKRRLKDVGDQIASNEKEYRRMRETIRKGENGISGGGDPTDSLIGGLARAGVLTTLASSISGFSNSAITSGIGVPEAALLSETLGGIASGAAMGSAIPGLGTVAGAVLGGASGLAAAATQILEAQDDAFKEYYNGLYETAKTATDEGITAGSELAAGRETDRLSFTTLLGDRGKAEDFLDSLVEMANYTPFLYGDLTAMSKTLATYGFQAAPRAGERGIVDSLTTIGDAGAALGHSTADMTAVATALGRMVSSNKATLEYLNILNDRGINAVGYLAEARGQSVGETYEAISKGEIAGGDAADIILAAMAEAFSGAMEQQSRTFSGLSSTMEGLRQEVENAGGERYNEIRSGGIQEEIDAYGGLLGRALESVNALAGENRAYLENLGERYTRDALSAVLLGDAPSALYNDKAQAQLRAWAEEYRTASAEYELTGSRDAALQMEALKENAEALATAAYESSEQYQALADTELDQIAAIRDSITATENLTGALNSYRVNQEQSKGMAARAWSGSEDTAAVVTSGLSRAKGKLSGKRHAFGLERVPYDGYPALLHEGERVLTASEARSEDRGGGVTVSIGSVTVGGGAGELDTWAVATAIAQELERAAVAAAPR